MLKDAADQIVQVGFNRFATLQDPLDESMQGTVNPLPAFEGYPPNDNWTEPEYKDWGEWISGTGTGIIELDHQQKVVRDYSIRHTTREPDYYARAIFQLHDGAEVNCDLYPRFIFAIALETAFSGIVDILLVDAAGKTVLRRETVGRGVWELKTLPVGSVNDDLWEGEKPFDWTKVKELHWICNFPGTGTGKFWLDGIFFSYQIVGLRALDVTIVVKDTDPPIPVVGASVVYGHLVGVDPETGKEAYFWFDKEKQITDETGRVVFSGLEPDWYGLQIKAKGFKDAMIPDIDLTSADKVLVIELAAVDWLLPLIVGSVLTVGGLGIIVKRLL